MDTTTIKVPDYDWYRRLEELPSEYREYQWIILRLLRVSSPLTDVIKEQETLTRTGGKEMTIRRFAYHLTVGQINYCVDLKLTTSRFFRAFFEIDLDGTKLMIDQDGSLVEIKPRFVDIVRLFEYHRKALTHLPLTS